jgi:cyclic pyranopterin phosphate synthase
MDAHAAVLEGLRAAAGAGFASVKIDTVVMRGVNDDELVPLVECARAHGAEIRFIEYMDVGGATRWSMDRVVTRDQILEALGNHYGGIEELDEASSAPADRFRLPDGTIFGIIASTTAPFCRSCDRSRLTADGYWLLCLYACQGTDLRRALRGGARREELVALVEAVWRERSDRGAEQRLDAHGRTAFIPVNALRADAHLEMHTRGG